MLFSKKIFGQKLRDLRKSKGMLQSDVAKALNIDRSTYTYYEIGKTCPSCDTLLDLKRLFSISLDWLLDPDCE